MHIIKILLPIVLLASTPVIAQSHTAGITIENGVSHALAVYRHKHIHQTRYDLSFQIPGLKNSPIQAEASISFLLTSKEQSLQLDFKQDSTHVQSITVNGRSIPIQFQKEHLIIDQAHLKTGANHINIRFIAGDESLHRNDDYCYALLVPDRARTVFPCFDQPDLKAIFTLSLEVPLDWKVLANAAVLDSIINQQNIVYHFKPSDQLPTYLFSFTAGKYRLANQQLADRNMGFLYRETDTAKIRLSVDSIFQAHRNAISFLQNWTGIPFPFQKIGFVAIPSFQFGGMEHPGVVEYNASSLFLDEGATRENIIGRTSLVSHETAHMWFGDMVTMEWFNDVWMKEVFANFMADKITEQLMGKETFNLNFLVDHYPAAYGIDRTAGANPIRQQLDNLQDAGSLYGNIIYHKAPIMMRQLESLMGKQSFQQGVREYLARYKYGNATWNDLIAILSKHSTAKLYDWNQVWVNQSGRPVFDYSIRYDQGLISQFTVSQHAEHSASGIWPQRFSIALVYPDHQTLLEVPMNESLISLPAAIGLPKPSFILFNADGAGYGLFPAAHALDTAVFHLKDPLQRASVYINAYENMLSGPAVKADSLLLFYTAGLTRETNEINLKLLTRYIPGIYWTFLSPAKRQSISSQLEQSIWTAMEQQPAANFKKLLFKNFESIYTSESAAQKIYLIWKDQKAPSGVKLTEDDYTSLAQTIALKTDKPNHVLEVQLDRISNKDRKSRLQFLMPALSPDAATRNQFFASLKERTNRQKEAWVTAGLSFINHPLRQQSFMPHLRETLDLLQEVQLTGDVFFPQSWLGAIFGNYRDKASWQVVQDFLNQHPNYNPKLKAKILQATDNLYRAQKMY